MNLTGLFFKDAFKPAKTKAHFSNKKEFEIINVCTNMTSEMAPKSGEIIIITVIIIIIKIIIITITIIVIIKIIIIIIVIIILSVFSIIMYC